MSQTEKILSFEQAGFIIARLKANGKKIVQCHGTFDLIHPGHVLHLEAAKALGDVLVVTVTAEKCVNKGPGRPYFNDILRARTLAALECVNHVVLVPYAGAAEAIQTVQPDIFCKGKAYENARSEKAERIQQDIAAVEAINGRICYVGAEVSNTSGLLNDYFDNLSEPVKAFCKEIATRYSPESLVGIINDFSKLRVLVIGDTIFDKYSYLKVQGLTSKNRIISGRFLNEETQCGGALAVFRHIKQFTGHAKFLSLVGTESWVQNILGEHLTKEEDLVLRERTFTTVVKQRFVEPVSEGKELSKLFSVNYLDAQPPEHHCLGKVLRQFEDIHHQFDLVIVADFGHGLMQPELRDTVQNAPVFLALNCQTNSNNHGFNILPRQYRRAHAFSLDEQELLLACGRRGIDYRIELEKLRQLLKADYAWLTRGAVETIGIKQNAGTALCPPFENKIIDTIGAGDAFFSVASLAAACDLPAETATFLGQLAGAQAVKIVGNARPISKSTLLRSCASMLNI